MNSETNTNPQYVWAIKSQSGKLLQMYYVAVEAEDEARKMAQKQDISITEIKRVLNTTLEEPLKTGEWIKWI